MPGDVVVVTVQVNDVVLNAEANEVLLNGCTVAGTLQVNQITQLGSNIIHDCLASVGSLSHECL